MNKVMRIYRLIDRVMDYSKSEANMDLPYDTVKAAVTSFCEEHPKPLYRTHVGDDHVARIIASNLTGKEIW